MRWDPARELGYLQNSIQRLFDGLPPSDLRQPAVPVDVYETAEEVVVRADLPGVDASDVQAHYHEGRLHIRATRRPAAPDGAIWLVREVGTGDCARSFGLGVPVNPEGVAANYADGVLEVRLPKAESAKPRSIPVEVRRQARGPHGK